MRLHTLRAAGLTALLLALVAVLESKSALGAFEANHGISAWQHAGLSVVCAFLAFVFSAMAGRMKCDVRPYVRSSAFLARLVSIAFLIVPTTYLAASLKIDRIEREWTAYYGSDAYAADVALAADDMADLFERRAARERITPKTAEITVVDGEFLLALGLQILVITAAGIPLHAPATAEEAQHWRRVQAGKKAAATRKRRSKAKAAKQKPRLTTIIGGKG